MSYKIANGVEQTSTTTGTGDMALDAPRNGRRAFVDAIGDGNTCPYRIDDEFGNYEIGYAQVAAGTPDKLKRGGTQTVIESMLGGTFSTSACNFPAGLKTVTCDMPAEMIVYRDSDGRTVNKSSDVMEVSGLGIGKTPTEMLDIKADQDAPTAVVIDNQYNGGNAFSRISMRAWGYTWFIQVGSTSANSNYLDFLGNAGNVKCMRINFHGVEVGDFSNTTETNCHFQIRGNGYAGEHWLDGDAYYIGQNSAVRQLRMFSGGSATTGVKLTVGATSWATTCDMTTKVKIEGFENALEKAASIEGFIGRYNDDAEDVRRSFINGQKLRSALPEATSIDTDGKIVARLAEIIPLHSAAFAEVASLITTMQAAIDALTQRVTALEAAH
jgi:hypothetical protein